MRPVTKLKVGEQIKVDGTFIEIEETYKPYQKAKTFLTQNIDEYCSYCERPASDEALAIEHIQAKKTKGKDGKYKYEDLTYKWTNFLLACARCNGVDNKSNKDVIYDEIYLPHLQNTFSIIQYRKGGVVSIHPNLKQNSEEYKRAKALIDLVGLDKRPGHPNYKNRLDKRWQKRYNAWQMAEKYQKKLDKDETDIESIIDIAKGFGFFSIWFTVFENHPKVRLALINAFKGTAKACFDEKGNPKLSIERINRSK